MFVVISPGGPSETEAEVAEGVSEVVRAASEPVCFRFWEGMRLGRMVSSVLRAARSMLEMPGFFEYHP